MKKIIALLMVTIMILSMGACGGKKAEESSAAAGGEGVKIGLSFISTSDAVIAQALDKARERAKEMGAELLISDAAGDANNQLNAVENFIESDCNVIIIQALDPESMSEKAKEAMDKGIKVIAYGIGLENCDVWYKNDNTVTGTAIGEMAAEWVNANKGGSANVLVIGYSMMDVLKERTEAMKSAMEKNCTGTVTFAAEFDALDSETGMKNTESALAANPDIDTIISISDGPAVGAFEAVKSAGKNDDSFGIFGSDLSLIAVQDIIDDTCYRGTIDVENLTSGIRMVEISVDLVNGNPVEEVIVMGCEKVTAENAGDYAYLLEK